LDSAARQSADAMINQVLVEMVKDGGIMSLAAFLSFDGEPDVSPAMNIMNQLGVQIVLPVIVNAPAATELRFRDWSPECQMRKNRFGIDEPVSGEFVPPRNLDLVLLPLVAWDESGLRLGMGAGYYDRILADVADRQKPLRVGAAYEVQKVPQLPADPWDVRLHQVITENGVFACQDRGLD